MSWARVRFVIGHGFPRVRHVLFHEIMRYGNPKSLTCMAYFVEMASMREREQVNT